MSLFHETIFLLLRTEVESSRVTRRGMRMEFTEGARETEQQRPGVGLRVFGARYDSLVDENFYFFAFRYFLESSFKRIDKLSRMETHVLITFRFGCIRTYVVRIIFENILITQN